MIYCCVVLVFLPGYGEDPTGHCFKQGDAAGLREVRGVQ